MPFGVCRLQLRPAADRKSQICEVKDRIWLKKDHTLISGVEEDSFTSPLLFSRYNHKITKYCWEEKRAHQRVTKWKMKVWKCQNSGSFIPQPGNKLLIVSRRWWLIAKTDFCRRNLLYTCRTWTQWLRWWIQPLLHSHSVFCCRSTCAVCCVQSHGLLLRVRESGGREEKQMEGRIWKQGEKHCQRKQEAALFVSVWVCVTDEKRVQPRSEGNY